MGLEDGSLWEIGHEGKTLMNGIRALLRREMGAGLHSLLSSLSGYDEKMAICRPEAGRPPPDAGSCVLILDFPASGTVRNKCLCF